MDRARRRTTPIYYHYKAPEPRTTPVLYGEPIDRGGRNPDDILLCGSENIVFAKRCLAAQSCDILNIYLGDHVVLAAEILQKMEANRVVDLALRFFRLPERELVATGRAMATILRDPNT